MQCRKAQRFVSLDLDGRLDESRRSALRTHLRNCPDCKRFAEQLGGMSDALAVVAAPEPIPGFTQRLMARLPERQSSGPLSRERRRAFRPAEVAAGGLGLAAGVIMAVLMNGEQVAATARAADLTQRMYAESFDPLPGGSAAANYVALVTEGGR